MAQLSWDRWHRTPGCRKWMDKTTFAGASFTDVFYRAMRLVFLDENGAKGLLYRGAVFPASQAVVAGNGGKRFGFSASDQARFLRDGNFKYDDDDFLGPLWPGGKLQFEGPDAGDGSVYAMGNLSKGQIRLHFYNIINDARNGTGSFSGGALPENASGVQQLAAFTGAIVLHEIMHNHGFSHPEQADWTPTTDYASSLPHVAFRSLLDAAKAEFGSTSLPLSQVKTAEPNASAPSAGQAGWSGWVPLGAPSAGFSGDPAVISRNPSVCNVYVRGGDNALWQNAYFDGSWHGWGRHDDGGVLASAPALDSMGPDHEHVFVRGGDNQVWQKWWTASGGWSGWVAHGAPPVGFVGDPAVVSRNPSVCNIYVRGGDNALWQNAYFDGSWHGWGRHDDGGVLASAPALGSMAPDHEHVFVRGGDNQVWQKWWTGSGGWSGWVPHGAPPVGFVGDPAIISRNNTVCNIYVRGGDNALWQNAYYDGGWHGWGRHDDGGVLASAPAPDSMGPGHEHVFVRGTDGQVWAKWWQ